MRAGRQMHMEVRFDETFSWFIELNDDDVPRLALHLALDSQYAFVAV
jgi:hypothetical protein